jgi:hypothetical protein
VRDLGSLEVHENGDHSGAGSSVLRRATERIDARVRVHDRLSEEVSSTDARAKIVAKRGRLHAFEDGRDREARGLTPVLMAAHAVAQDGEMAEACLRVAARVFVYLLVGVASRVALLGELDVRERRLRLHRNAWAASLGLEANVELDRAEA